MNDSCLCLDIGSTNIKFALFENGKRTDCGSCPFPAPSYAENGFFEVDADAVYERARSAIDRYPLAKNVFISVQMHGHVLSSKAGKYVSWRDQRSLNGNIYEKYEKLLGALITPDSGTCSKPNLAVYSLLYDYETGNKPSGELFSLGSYIAYRLTGRNVSHVTDLCAQGFYLKNGQPNGKLLSELPFEIGLPACVPETSECGVYRNKRIFAPVGDQQISVFALQEERFAVLNMGTAAQICRVADGDVYGNYESRPYFGKKTLCTVTGLTGGAVLRENAGSLAVKAGISAQFNKALRDLNAGPHVLCTGGAFSYHRDLIFAILSEAGYVPSYRDADALDGLELLGRMVK